MKKIIANAIPKIIGFLLNTLSFLAPKLAAKKALDLFATPRKGKVLENQETFLNTAIQNVLPVDDASIMTYCWKGTRKTVLLAHGWESNSFRWHKLVKTLQENDFNIIALDAPAHGNTSGKQFNAILYAEYINVVAKHFKPQIIIGHSVGGMASVFFQEKYQLQSLEKLILLGAPSEFVNIFKNYTTLLGLNSNIKRHLRKLIIHLFGNTPESFSSASYLKNIAVNGLIIHDKKDRIIAYNEALLIKDSFKNAQLISTKGFGHSLHHDSVNKHILEFLNS